MRFEPQPNPKRSDRPVRGKRVPPSTRAPQTEPAALPSDQAATPQRKSRSPAPRARRRKPFAL